MSKLKLYKQSENLYIEEEEISIEDIYQNLDIFKTHNFLLEEKVWLGSRNKKIQIREQNEYGIYGYRTKIHATNLLKYRE